MSFRTKVLTSMCATVAVAVWLVAWLISSRITRLYEQREGQRAATLIKDFHREFARRGDEIAAAVSAIAASDEVMRIAAQTADPGADLSQYVNDAEQFAREQSLPLVEIVGPDGAIVSSAHWPARFGYHEDWLTAGIDWNATKVFLRSEQLPDGPVLALMAVRSLRAGDRQIYIAGGIPLDRRFIQSLAVPEGMRIVALGEQDGPQSLARDLYTLAAETRTGGREQTRVVRTTSGEEVATAIPLTGLDGKVHAVLLAIQSRSELLGLRRAVRRIAVFVGGGAVLAGVVLGFWAASRVTRPVRRLADSVRQVAAGDWNARADVESRDEIGQLAADFNTMADQLVDQRNRMLQAERVAAWREIARRLAHELKNPLFPLQITVENLRRARDAAPAEFDEVFNESTSTLLAELNNLKAIISRFGDFARMPAPRFETVNVNDIARDCVRLFEAQASASAAARVTTHLDLTPGLPSVQADPEQLQRALRNLALNALDAMPEGGDLTFRTAARDGKVVIEIADTGQGLTPEERARLFTPYYTTKQHGTGLGLAIVQSVVSDHGGTIAVDSEPGHGSVFRIELKT